MNAPLNLQAPLLELDLLNTLVAIAETGNFSAAAEVVFRTPSAVSMQVKRIEEILGRPVFNRDSRSVTLTVDGEKLLTHARRLLALNRELMAQFISPDIVGEVRLGTVDHLAEQFLPGILKRFNETHPGVAVEVTVEGSMELARRVKAGMLDLAIVTCEVSEYCELPVEVIHREELVWAGLKCGVAVEQTPLPLSVWEEGCVWRKAAIDGLDKIGREFRVNFKSAYTSGQKAALLADLAIAPLPASSCDGNIVQLESKYGLPPLGKYSIGLVKVAEISAPVNAVVDYLRASFAQL